MIKYFLKENLKKRNSKNEEAYKMYQNLLEKLKKQSKKYTFKINQRNVRITLEYLESHKIYHWNIQSAK